MNTKYKYLNIYQEIIAENINNFIEINNKYRPLGFEIFLKNNIIEIIYNHSVFTVQI